MRPERAWILLPSGHRLNLLDPDPLAWTESDLAVGLSRTYRWAGYSRWSLPLSVAQHSLTVLALFTRTSDHTPSPPEARRELLHDATEGLLGGWDPITPLKPCLGDGFTQLVARLQSALDERYRLPAWDEESYRRHKEADRLAAASEAFHVVGWPQPAMREDLGICLEPLAEDPLAPVGGFSAWEPWPPNEAARRFLGDLEGLSAENPPQRNSDGAGEKGA